MSEREEKREGAEIVLPKNRFSGWLDNFWYHYKWHTVIIIAVLAICLVGLVQCSTGKKGDVAIAYAGGHSMSTDQRSALIQAMSMLVKNEEGENLTVMLSDYPVFSDEELRVMFTDPETGDFSVSGYESMRQASVKNAQTFGDYIMTGQTGLYLVRESVYQSQAMYKLAAPLTETFGADDLPSGAYDEYAVKLCETEFYQYYEALHFLPEDTLIVLTRPYIFGETSDKETYAHFEALFKAMIEFQK